MKRQVHNLAFSVRQPFAEQIIHGTKKIEFRSRKTNIRGRVYIYASKKITSREKEAYKKMKVELGTFPVGILVGTVEIVDCKERSGEYHWILAKPKRLKKLVKPKSQPQPVWFKPFKE